MRFLAALVLSACSAVSVPEYSFHTPPVPFQETMTIVRPVYIDRTFDEADVDSIRGAVYAWNETLSGTIRLEVKQGLMTLDEMLDPRAILVMKVDSTCTFIPTIPEGRVLAWTDRIGGQKVWVIRDRLETYQLAPVMTHEFGHVFGADDRKGHGLMHYQFGMDEYKCIDKATVEEVATWQGLPMSALGYCE